MVTTPATTPAFSGYQQRLIDRLRPAVPPVQPLKVFMWPADATDGCRVYRCDIPAAELNRLGHEVRVAQRFDDWGRYEADIFVGQRIAPLKPSVGWQKLCQEAKRAGRRRMVYEVDDNLFDIDPAVNPHAAVFHIPAIRKNMIDNLRDADLVTVTTPGLADRLARYNDNIAVVPNAVRTEVRDIVLPTRRGQDAGRVIYGWQGSATHTQDWLQAEAPIVELLASTGDTHLRFLGTWHVGGLLQAKIPHDRYDAFGWTTDIMAHYKRVSRFDVTLAPLADTKFNASKSALRVQESLALGVPVVASDVPAYRGWVEHGVTGFLCRTPADWADALQALRDPALRLAMGDAGLRAADGWTVERSIGGWLDAYRSLLP